jgi:hypothetical protein
MEWNIALVTDKACVDISYVTILLRIINFDINTKTSTFFIIIEN